MISLICGIKKKIHINLFTKEKQRHRKETYVSQKAKGGINQEYGTTRHILLQTTDKNLLYNTGSYIQYLVLNLFSCVRLFCDLMDCSLPGSSVHGVSQAGILEWVAISFFSVSCNTYNGKESEAIHSKITQYCKSTIVQLKNFFKLHPVPEPAVKDFSAHPSSRLCFIKQENSALHFSL